MLLGSLILIQATLAANPANAGPAYSAAEAGTEWPAIRFAGASFWSRYELRDRYDALGRSVGRRIEGDAIFYRARLRLATPQLDLGSKARVEALVAPQLAGYWGRQPNSTTPPNLGAYEAFVRFSYEDVELMVGRMALNYGDALLIGSLAWNEYGRAFEGVKLRYSDNDTWFDIFAMQSNEGFLLGPVSGSPNPTPAHGDTLFTGLYASLGSLVSPETILEPYVLGSFWFAEDNSFDAEDGVVGGAHIAIQATVGARAKHRWGPVDGRIEVGGQFGRRRIGAANPEVMALQVDGELGWTHHPHGRIAMEGAFATGDNPRSDRQEGWDQLFPAVHKFLGLTDIIGARTNVASAALHVQQTVGPVVALVDAHAFWRPTSATGRAGFAGSEVNLQIQWRLLDVVRTHALYGIFVPASEHFQVDMRFSDDIAQYVELQVGLEM